MVVVEPDSGVCALAADAAKPSFLNLPMKVFTRERVASRHGLIAHSAKG
jgi:hypothetical protein